MRWAKWISIGLALFVVSFGMLVFFKGGNKYRQYAINSCDPYSMGVPEIQRFENCMPKKFGPGTDMAYLKKYIEGAEFSLKSSSIYLGSNRDVYLLNVDYEKGPRELLLIVRHKNGVVSKIYADEWNSSNWLPDGIRPLSPFLKCLGVKNKCEENSDG